MATSSSIRDRGPRRAAFGRRVARRRAELHLRLEEVAERSGCAPAYLAHVEEEQVTPEPGLVLRLARGLRTHPAELAGEPVEFGAGYGHDAQGLPELVEMDESECRERLSTHGEGRVAVFGAEGPDVVPVHYLLTGGELVFRTSAGAVPVAAAGADIAFEADHLSAPGGWSVLVAGHARAVVNFEAVLRFEELAEHLPAPGPASGLWIALAPTRVSGFKTVAAR
ncbi:pyridoxamine 5'-phosphate oxidase family protein [Streptomyces sp. NA04227]|uniref:helix-turn-helix domain-containing protein n=1 Tax=Streptomyces sp. NA04227 TaxID=2742136 RepID=UPI0015900DFA|nr:pyridoxamine 5'-phosphate oxidase family protein [Streptomyces sp. NA04227]QKW05144.1 pyridoxamine 5'-phosphate oxidase family protein [Streptomyces sp. NA04227]